MRVKIYYIFITFLASSCASNTLTKFSKDNFRTVAEHKIDDTKYYSSKYIGKEKGCFPDDVTNICFNYALNRHELEIVNQLDIKTFTVSASSWNGYIGPDEKELVYLVAAEIAEQLKYKYISDYFLSTYGSCNNRPTAYTSGTFTGNTYSSTTTVQENTNCLYSFNVQFIVFNKYEDLKTGVVELEGEKVRPFTALYGAGNNLRTFPLSFKIEVQDKGATESKMNVWKTFFNVQKLISETRKKFNLGNEKFVYELKFTKSKPLSMKEQSPLQSSRIIMDE